MNNIMERRILNLIGTWQIIDGLFTILIYGTYKRFEFSQIKNLDYRNAKAFNSLFGNMYIFISAFGSLLVILGILNLVISKTKLTCNEIKTATIVWSISQLIFSLIVGDIIGFILLLIFTAVLLARNSALKKMS